MNKNKKEMIQTLKEATLKRGSWWNNKFKEKEKIKSTLNQIYDKFHNFQLEWEDKMCDKYKILPETVWEAISGGEWSLGGEKERAKKYPSYYRGIFDDLDKTITKGGESYSVEEYLYEFEYPNMMDEFEEILVKEHSGYKFIECNIDCLVIAKIETNYSYYKWGGKFYFELDSDTKYLFENILENMFGKSDDYIEWRFEDNDETE